MLLLQVIEATHVRIVRPKVRCGEASAPAPIKEARVVRDQRIAHLDKLANKPAHRDGTHYGSRRGATRSYRRHHISEISSALVYADAETLLAHAEGAPV